MNKPKIQAFDFTRAVCTLGIVAYHYCASLEEGTFRPFYEYKNGNWGGALVAVFFLLSGASLSYRYEDCLNTGREIRQYFAKRWLSIFPMYYLAYGFFEIRNMISYGDPFFRGNPVRYLYTLLGMDGYLANRTTTYYILGEWFTGAILILYLIFPALLWCFKKSTLMTTGMVILFYLVFLDKPIINAIPYCSVTSCLLSFFLGMLFVKYRKKLLKPWFVIFCTAGIFLLLNIPLEVSEDPVNHLMGVCLFGVLTGFGTLCMKYRIPEKVFGELSRISYAIFLMHHVTILQIFVHWKPQNIAETLWGIAGMMVLAVIEAEVLTLVVNWLLKCHGCNRSEPGGSA
jgi:peptidoglycan/LPS O-acetylase OafA/YrhL